MTESAVSHSPHVYYSVPELSMVKDVRVMKNTKVKTIGYLYRKKRAILKESPDSSICLAVDMSYIDHDIIEIYPYIIFGVLYTLNESPTVAVKFLEKLDFTEADLEKYKEQCLLLRNRLSRYDNILNLAKSHNWT